MAKGYKIRLPDGSEIGPMDLQAVKDWYVQGLVGKDDLVMKPGTSRWVPLRNAVNLDEARTPAVPKAPSSPAGASPELRAAVRAAAGPRTAPPSRGGSAAADEAADEPSESQPWRTILGGALLLVGAAAAGFFAFFPDRWHPVLDATPWREIGLGQAALGLLLVRGWDVGRKLARVLLVVAAFALFPVAGILLAQGVRGTALLVMASAFVIAVGFVALLAGGELSFLRAAVSLVAVLAGWACVLRFGAVPENPDLRQIREAASPERRFDDPAAGVSLEVPSGWLVLRPDQTLLEAPAGARMVLGQPRLGGFAVLAADTSPRGLLSEDDYLTRVLQARALPGRTEAGRSDVSLGSLVGRQVLSQWERDGRRYRDVMVSAKDGRTFWSLTAWVPDDGSARAGRELEDLVRGVAITGAMARQHDAAVQAIIRDVPHLTTAAAETILARVGAEILEPQETFRRAYELASRGLPALTPAEGSELGALNAAAASGLSKKERAWLTAYLERVRDGRLTTPDEDREACRLMKGSVLRLPPPRLQRLQALYEKAIEAAP